MSSTILRTSVKAAFSASALGVAVALATATAAGAAATQVGNVTITDSSNTALTGPQASTQVFNATVPQGAACPGSTASTANGGPYRVYSFLVAPGTEGSLNFAAGHPSSGFGYYSTNGTYQLSGGLNTDTSGLVLPSTNLEFGTRLNATTVSTTNGGLWDSGWLCADGTGAVTNYWMQQIQFTASSTDLHGYTWTPVAASGVTTPEVPLTVALPLGGAGIIGAGYVVNRRKSRRASTAAA